VSRRAGLTPVQAAVARERSKSVFINCPYDDGYGTVLDALIFAVVCCGFTPRSAVEGLFGGQRMSRIGEPLRDSQLSIHDLSRYRYEPPRELARFNMPFELGMAFEMERAFDYRESDFAHQWLVLAPRDMPFKDVISDLAGFDPLVYTARDDLVRSVILWLIERRRELGLKRLPIPVDRCVAALGDCDVALRQQRPEKTDARSAWNQTVQVARSVARQLLGAPAAAA